MSTYSFLDVKAALTGPGVVANLADGAAAAKEGITVVAVEDKNAMLLGADGSGQHSLNGSEASTVTVRLLKTSPMNAVLMAAYNLQTRSSRTHGKNTIVVSDTARGDLVTLQKVAFKKVPDLTYAGEGGINEWTFDAIKTSRILGAGL